MGLFPQTQVLKDLFDDLRLVNKADDAHFPLVLRAGQGVCFVDFSDEVGPALKTLRRVLRRMSRGYIDSRNQSVYDWQFRNDERFRKTFLEIMKDERTVERGIVDAAGIDRLISAIDSGMNYFGIVEVIVTTELFFRRYVDDSTPKKILYH